MMAIGSSHREIHETRVVFSSSQDHLEMKMPRGGASRTSFLPPPSTTSTRRRPKYFVRRRRRRSRRTNHDAIIFDAAAHAATTISSSHHRKGRLHYHRKLLPLRSSAFAAAVILLLSLAATSTASSTSASSESLQPSPFRIVIDVGSTGSRLHIFELVASAVVTGNNNSNDGTKNASSDESDGIGGNNNMPLRTECLRRGSSKAWTPLSAFASQSSSAEEDQNNEPLNATHVAHHMLPLFDYANEIIPREYRPSTRVRIAATAGMRLFPRGEQARVYDALHGGLLEQAANGRFAFTNLGREDVMTLNGEREGFYGAVAANYLRGVIDAELNIIVRPEMEEHDEEEFGSEGGQKNELLANREDANDQGLCTNKFGMCEQDAENVVFGPSHHYIKQGMHDFKRHGPMGALDMGGSSTQIVYRHDDVGDEGGEQRQISGAPSVAFDDVPSNLNDEKFFTSSYLSYGADQFRERLWDLWVTEARRNSPAKDNDGHGHNLHVIHSPSRDVDEHNLPVIFNPCSFVGHQVSYKGHVLLGTGDALLCAEQINRLIPHHDDAIDLDELYEENIESSISKEVPHRQTMKRKMVGGVEHPPIRGKFYGMSLYFFTLDCLRELSDPDHPIHVSWPTPSIEELTHALDAFCARKWQGDLEEVQHEAHEHTRAEVLPHRCVEAVYMVTLLRDGFGFHPTSRDITFTQWVEGNEVEWSLGMALSEFASAKQKESSPEDDDDAL